jgi:hypothetical protein
MEAQTLTLSSLGFTRDDKGEGRDFNWEPSGRMDKEKPQVPPLRFAPAGMTNSFKTRSLRTKNP